MDLSGFTPLIAFGLAVYTIMNVIKYLRAMKWWAATTPLLAWVVAFLVLLLARESSWADNIKVGDGTIGLSRMNIADVILVAIYVASVAGFLDKYIAAKDNTQTAAVPSLSETPLPKVVQHQMGETANATVRAATPPANSDVMGYVFRTTPDQ